MEIHDRDKDRLPHLSLDSSNLIRVVGNAEVVAAPSNNHGSEHLKEPKDDITSIRPPAAAAKEGGNAPPQPKVPVPVYPKLKMRELPFLKMCSVLMLPTGLVPKNEEFNQTNHLTLQVKRLQVEGIVGFLGIREKFKSSSMEQELLSTLTNKIKILVRFCATYPPTERYKPDLFPTNLTLQLNGCPIPLPRVKAVRVLGAFPQRKSKPLDITKWFKWVGSNTLNVSWDQVDDRRYALQVYAATQLTSEDLLRRIKKAGELPKDFTLRLINSIAVVEEDGISTTNGVNVDDSIKLSMNCPISQTKIRLPCRSLSCKHVQCFDAAAFLQMNEKKSKFICPVCNQLLRFDELRIDGYFSKVLKELPVDAGETVTIIIHPNGRWELVKEENKPTGGGGPSRKRFKTNDGRSRIRSFSPESVSVIELDNENGKETPPLSALICSHPCSQYTKEPLRIADEDGLQANRERSESPVCREQTRSAASTEEIEVIDVLLVDG